MKLETERLLIRHFTLNDCGAALEYLSDPKTMKYVEPPYDERHVRSFIFKQCRDRPAVYPVVLKATDELIGHVIFAPYGDPAIFEVGWIFGSKYWGQGYAEEAGRALIACAFGKAGVHRLFAETLEENEACRKLLTKLCFEQEGALRLAARGPFGWEDMCLYGLINPMEGE